VFGKECDITVLAGFFWGGGGVRQGWQKNFDVAAAEACLCYRRDGTCWVYNDVWRLLFWSSCIG
jgi:hypothetical protein